MFPECSDLFPNFFSKYFFAVQLEGEHAKITAQSDSEHSTVSFPKRLCKLNKGSMPAVQLFSRLYDYGTTRTTGTTHQNDKNIKKKISAGQRPAETD